MENKTLIVYDLNGIIIYQATGFYQIPKGVPYLEVSVPNGKYVSSINVEAQEAIFEDIPLTENQIMQEKISILEAENKTIKQELALTQDAVNEMLFMMMNMEVK